MGTINDREFWIAIRSALIMAVRAIEKRWSLHPCEFGEISAPAQVKPVALRE